jgi:flavin reductase (DIM6/NTAB) family NADH-FMN oxidoreductase RutF
MITSRGPNGPNIMAAEWVMQISYQPVLIAVFIHRGSMTLKNIEKTREFGVNVASHEQIAEVNISGGYSGTEIDKLKIKNIFKLIKPQKLKKIPLIAGCIINAECKLVKKERLGDHIMLVGKVVGIRHDESKSPLIYHKGRYFGPISPIEQDRKEVQVSKKILEFFKNIAQKRFVLKCVGVLVKSRDKIMVIRKSKTVLSTIPFSIPPAGMSQRDHLIKFLHKMRLDIQVDGVPIMRRLVLKNKKDVQRINFVLFAGKSRKCEKMVKWKYFSDDRLISALI